MKTLNKSLFILGMIILTTLTLAISSNANDHKSGKSDIVTTAVNNGNFNTLAKALQAAELIEALQADGPFTVFAPTDEAFSKLPDGTLDDLLNDKEALTEILLYHVVSGEVTASQVKKISNAETLSGKSVNISSNSKSVMINNSMVTAADIMASNGVIHVIDTVLLPPSK